MSDSWTGSIAERVRELERELAEARIDAARYQYLRAAEVKQPRVDCVYRVNGNAIKLMWGEELDAAIDAARKP